MELQNEVRERLKQFGYKAEDEDELCIAFCINKVCEQIKNKCNTEDVPSGLKYTAIDMICGEFLFTKKQTGRLELEALDLDGAITQIHEGDITVQFADGASDEEKLNTFLNYLLHNGEGDFVCYRKLKW